MKHLAARSLVVGALLVDASAFVIIDEHTAQVAFTRDNVVNDDTHHLWSEELHEETVLLPDAEERLNPWVTTFNRELNTPGRRHRWNGNHGEDIELHDEADDHKPDSDPFAPSNFRKLKWIDSEHERGSAWKGRRKHCNKAAHAAEQRCSWVDYIKQKPGCTWRSPDRDDHPPPPPPDRHHPSLPPSPHHPPPPRGPHPPPPPPGEHPPHPPPGKHPHRPPHRKRPHHEHDFTNGTIFQNLGLSKYTTKIFSLISKDKELTELLNSTSANFTFFAPVDKAFEKIPEHGKHPSDEFIANLLRYHTAAGEYPLRRVLVEPTIPTLFKDDGIGGEAQRLKSSWGRLNLYSKAIVSNVFSKNGVVHGVDHIIVPPPPAHAVLEILPGHFSTFVNGLYKTGLHDHLANDKRYGTLFAPTNGAFKRLGPKVLAFLFSKFGEKYLKALLEYHIAVDGILYSNAWVKPKEDDDDKSGAMVHHEIPKGRFHADLRTALKGRDLSIDIARWGRFISFKINGFTRVVFQDGVVKDGVIHVPSRVLIPPRRPQPGDSEKAAVNDEEICMTVEMLKERLEPYLT